MINMEWISVEDRLPDLFEIVWIYWRNREVILGCKTASDCEANECWYSFDDEKCRFTDFWMSHKDHPIDPPEAPK